MGQPLLSLLKLVPALPGAAALKHVDSPVGDLRKPLDPRADGQGSDAKPTDSLAAADSAFSKFLARRASADMPHKDARAATPDATAGKAKTQAKSDGQAPRAATEHTKDHAPSADKSTACDHAAETDADAESADAASDPAASDTNASDPAEADAPSTEHADAADQTNDTATDTTPDANTESMLMGFFAGQVVTPPPAVSGGSGAAAIAASATSAPAPIPALTDAPSPLAAPVDATEEGMFAAALGQAVPDAAPALPAALQAVLQAMTPSNETAAPSPVVTAASAASSDAAAPKAVAATPLADADAAEAEGTPGDSLAKDAAAPALPRRLGRQEPVLPPAAADHAGPPASPLPPAPALAVPVARAAVESALRETTVDNAAATPVSDVSAGLAAPANAAPTAAPGAKFELAGAPAAASASTQILAHVATLPKGRGTQFSLQLEPLHLGKVEVVMSIQQDGALQMHIRAESREALASLQRDASQLERSLQDLGLKTDGGSLQFSLKQEGQQHPAFAQFDQQSQGRSGQGASAGRTGSGSDDAPLPTRTIAYRAPSADGLDIHV